MDTRQTPRAPEDPVAGRESPMVKENPPPSPGFRAPALPAPLSARYSGGNVAAGRPLRPVGQQPRTPQRFEGGLPLVVSPASAQLLVRATGSSSGSPRPPVSPLQGNPFRPPRSPYPNPPTPRGVPFQPGIRGILSVPSVGPPAITLAPNQTQRMQQLLPRNGDARPRIPEGKSDLIVSEPASTSPSPRSATYRDPKISGQSTLRATSDAVVTPPTRADDASVKEGKKTISRSTINRESVTTEAKRMESPSPSHTSVPDEGQRDGNVLRSKDEAPGAKNQPSPRSMMNERAVENENENTEDDDDDVVVDKDGENRSHSSAQGNTPRQESSVARANSASEQRSAIDSSKDEEDRNSQHSRKESLTVSSPAIIPADSQGRPTSAGTNSDSSSVPPAIPIRSESRAEASGDGADRPVNEERSLSSSPIVPPTSSGSSRVPPTSSSSPLVPPTSSDSPLTPPKSPGSSPIPPTSSGSPLIPPTSPGSSPIPPKSSGSPLVPPISPGSSSIPPKSSGSPLVPPISPGSSPIPPKSSGSPLVPPISPGSSPIPPKSSGSPLVPPISPGSSPIPPKSSGSPLVPPISPGSSPIPPKSSGSPLVPPISPGSSPIPPTSSGSPLIPTSRGSSPIPPTSGSSLVPPSSSGSPLVPPTASDSPLVPPTSSGSPLIPPSSPGSPPVPPASSGSAPVPSTASDSLPEPPMSSGSPLVPPTSSDSPVVPPTSSGSPLIPPSSQDSPLVPPTSATRQAANDSPTTTNLSVPARASSSGRSSTSPTPSLGDVSIEDKQLRSPSPKSPSRVIDPVESPSMKENIILADATEPEQVDRESRSARATPSPTAVDQRTRTPGTPDVGHETLSVGRSPSGRSLKSGESVRNPGVLAIRSTGKNIQKRGESLKHCCQTSTSLARNYQHFSRNNNSLNGPNNAGGIESGADRTNRVTTPTTNGVALSPTKRQASKSSTNGSPLKSPSKSVKSLPRTPEAAIGAPPSTAEKKKVPMNKIQVGAAPSPNLKTVRSKIGSLDNASYKPGGGKVKIENRKLDFSKAQPKIAAKNDKYTPSGGEKKIPQVKLQWNAKPKVGSLDNATYKPGGGDKKIETVKLDFKDKAKPKVGSRDNAKHVPGGGTVKIETQKIDIRAESKVGSLDNVGHKPGGGDKKIFDDREYTRRTGSNVESQGGSEAQSPVPPNVIGNNKNEPPISDENLNEEC